MGFTMLIPFREHSLRLPGESCWSLLCISDGRQQLLTFLGRLLQGAEREGAVYVRPAAELNATGTVMRLRKLLYALVDEPSH